MTYPLRRLRHASALAALLTCSSLGMSAQAVEDTNNHWTPCGWGGGGYFYAAAWHPENENIVYLGSDVCGTYRSEHKAQQWHLANDGIANYGIFPWRSRPPRQMSSTL